MKAMAYTRYGPPEVLELQEVEKPAPKDKEALVEIRVASVVFADWAFVRGRPFLVRLMGQGLFRPKNTILGADIAGRVESVGRDVEHFQPGDEVFGDVSGSGYGGFAEYVAVPEKAIAQKPSNVSFEQAAAAPQAASVALQGLRDVGRIQPGQQVLINGASGGNGTFAVQVAKSFGAEVTGVCGTRSLDMVRSIGAEHVIDYTKEDFTTGDRRYDLIFDIVANRSISAYMRALRPKGRYVACAFNPTSLFLGPWLSMFGSKTVRSLAARSDVKDLVVAKELIEAGKVVPVIDRCYPLTEVAEAVRYYGEGHPQGKVVIAIKSLAGAQVPESWKP